MFFSELSEIPEIASRTGAAVFVVPDVSAVDIPGAIVVQPEEKTSITIEQIRQVIKGLSLKQTVDLYVLIRPADKMNPEAENAFLKNLEEPGERVHFVLVTSEPSGLLPTILSRAGLYFLRETDPIGGGVQADEKVKDLAKRLMVAKGADLVAVAEEIAKKKDGVRAYALSVVGVAIEMLYKSYFLTGKMAFVNRLPKFLEVYEAILQNGHIKLQIVAGLG